MLLLSLFFFLCFLHTHTHSVSLCAHRFKPKKLLPRTTATPPSKPALPCINLIHRVFPISSSVVLEACPHTHTHTHTFFLSIPSLPLLFNMLKIAALVAMMAATALAVSWFDSIAMLLLFFVVVVGFVVGVLTVC